jgi:RNA polymerase sigma factor (sigma-70 family)
MSEHEWLVEEFETHRDHLMRVAYRMLGSVPEADDAVQETWLRLSRTDATTVENIGGWLTTVVGRVCLDALRSRRARREEFQNHGTASALPEMGGLIDPEEEALLGDSVGLALLVILETLSPAERVAFVLHDMFAVPFDEIATIVGRSPQATRQLASRARRRVQGATPSDKDVARQREVVEAFLAASRKGDFDALLAVLDPDIVVHADAAAVEMGAAKEVQGASVVAGTFAGRARAAQPALIDGVPGLVWSQRGTPQVVFGFTITRGKIVEISMVADPERLGQLNVEFLD